MALEGVAPHRRVRARLGGRERRSVETRVLGVLHRLRQLDPLDRQRRRYRVALAAALEDIARDLRSGASLPQALAGTAGERGDPVAADLAVVVDRLDRGRSLPEALTLWRARVPDPAVALATAALELAHEVGGAGARAVDQVAATVREGRALDGELRAQSSQARLSALILVTAPVAFAAFSATVDPRVLAFLATDPIGWACLALGLALDGAGALWMARITRSIP